jgi:hypothetical protein
MLNDDQFDAVRAGDWYCVKCPSNNRGNTPFRYWWDSELTQARERRLAAVPQLLEACKAALEVLDDDMRNVHLVERACKLLNAAIAKAEGQS